MEKSNQLRMPSGWKKNVPRREISVNKKSGGGRHHRTEHGNASRRNCCMCSLGVDRSASKVKGALKERKKALFFQSQEESDDVVYENGWLENTLQEDYEKKRNDLELYNKRLCDYISAQHISKMYASTTPVDVDIDSGWHLLKNRSNDIEGEWEIVSLESVYSLA